MAIVTLTVRGKSRPLTMRERINSATAARGKVADAYVWPVPVPEYGKGAAAKARRTRNYWDAVGACETMTDAIASAIAAGHKVAVTVETGAVVTADRERGIYANVIAPVLLQGIMAEAFDVEIHAGAEDPRDYIEPEPEPEPEEEETA